MDFETMGFSKETIQDKWQELSPVIEQLMVWMGEVGGTEVPLGSDMYADEKWTRPFNMSSVVIGSMVGAIDHLHALKSLVWDTRTHHLTAPYTLARSSIEAASVAVWIMAPDQRAERVMRALQCVSRNARNEHGVMGTDPQPTLERIGAIAQSRGLSATEAQRGFKPSTVVAMAEKEVKLSTDRGWELFSGFTHSRPWALVNMLDGETISEEAEMTTLRLTSGSALLLWAARIAYFATERAVLLWTQRTTPHDRRSVPSGSLSPFVAGGGLRGLRGYCGRCDHRTA